MMNKCDCFLGWIENYRWGGRDYMHMSNYKKISEGCSKYIDNPSKYGTLFSYCPNCGNEIDWNKLREDMTNAT